MIIKKYKKGFTLIELMAVVGIVVMLLAITTPLMNGYINRANKVSVITQSRDVIHLAVSSNIDINSNIKLDELIEKNMFQDYKGDLEYLQDDIEVCTLKSITLDENAINKIIIENKKIVEWIGENPYKKSND